VQSSIGRGKKLKEIAWVFFKLGTIAFGGPAAHIAMMEDEVVKRRQWLSREKLLDLLGIIQLIPGPNSTELAIHIGYEQAGLAGLAIAGVCFIVPAMLLVWGLAIVYMRSQTLPQTDWILYGVKPVIIAIVGQALWKLGRTALKDRPTQFVGLVVAIAYFLKLNEILLLVLAGLGVMLYKNLRRKLNPPKALWILPSTGLMVQLSPTVQAPSVLSVFLFFLKIGAVLYGSGYVLLAFLQRELVERSHWLTDQQLLDAIAVGQITPGPVFTTATFVGYLLASHLGAIAGTVGIFLPAFILVAVVNPWVSKLRSSLWAGGFLDGVNAASLGLMAGVTWTLGLAAIIDWMTVAIALLSGIALVRFKVNSAWLVIGGAVLGAIVHFSLGS
jgi:chromate transporter